MGTVCRATIGGTKDSSIRAAWFLGGDHKGALKNRSRPRRIEGLVRLRGTEDNVIFLRAATRVHIICGLGTSSGLDTSSWLDVLGQRRDGGYQHRRQHDGQQQQLLHYVFLSGVWSLRLVGLYASIFVAFLLSP